MFRGYALAICAALCVAAPVAATAANPNTEFIAPAATISATSVEANVTSTVRDTRAAVAVFGIDRASPGSTFLIDRRAPRYVDPG